MKSVFFILLASTIVFFIYLGMAYITMFPQNKEYMETRNAIDVVNIDQKLQENLNKNSPANTKNIKPENLDRSKVLETHHLSILDNDQRLALEKSDLNIELPNLDPETLKDMIPKIDNSQFQSFINKPLYPYEAYRNNIDGWVLLKLFITKTGTVENVELLDSEPKGVFENVAIKTAYKKVFPIKKGNLDPKKHTRNLKIHYKADEQLY